MGLLDTELLWRDPDGEPCSFDDWMKYRKTELNMKTTVGGCQVSTVFIGMGQVGGDQYETMVFGPSPTLRRDYTSYYRHKLEAIDGHHKIVMEVSGTHVLVKGVWIPV
jgi:hypothetical protein